MSTPILATKLYIPPPRPNFVSRSHLIEKLDQGLQFGHKLTLISAPAGFGKTTLISEWLASLIQLQNAESNPKSEIRSPELCWLSLDEGDNDPTRFLAYLIAALQRAAGEETAVGQGALDMLQSPQTLPATAVLTALINDITALPRRPAIILTIDDYHVIDSAPVDDALTYLLEHLPPNMHLVIATRIDPHLPFARLRAQDQLTELRATDLRFSSAEAAEFLNHMMGLDLSAEDISALETRTEGWIAGLQLAAISMQGQKDTHTLISSFTGSHRYVLDYLIEEVLEQQPPNIQDFLLQTALFERLTGSLCDAVRFGETPNSPFGTAITGQKDGQATLEMLDRANLFIVPLDEQRHWYRYHHLFADLLRQRLHQTQPDRIPSLHLRASEWFEQNSFFDEAIDQALLAGDSPRAAGLIAREADDVWKRGDDSKLRRWLDSLPLELVYNNSQFCVYLAWSLLADGELDEAEKALQEAERAFESYSDTTIEMAAREQNQSPDTYRRALRGRIATTRAFAAFYRGEFPELFQHISSALKLLPEQELSWRSTAAHLLGDAYFFQGDMVQAYQYRAEAVEASRATGNSYVNMIANLKLALILRHHGQLRQAMELCEQQMAIATDNGMAQTVVAGWLLAIWGDVLAEINDLAGARLKAQNSAERLQLEGDLAMIGAGYLNLIRILFSCGDLAAAEEIVYKLEHIARESDMPPWISSLLVLWQARIWLAQGKQVPVSQPMNERDLQNLTHVHEAEYIAYARLLIAHEQLDEAAALLARLQGPAQSYGRTWRVIEMLILQALAYQAADDTDSALTALEQALTLAEPGGFIRTFVDEGPPMANLLHKAASRGILPDYVGKLLQAFSTTTSQQVAPPQVKSAISKQSDVSEAAKSKIIEALSQRELEVLQLIAQGLTNSQIAARLYLSLNTVKAHTRNIYGKLDVHNRTQAVAQARTLGLLSPI